MAEEKAAHHLLSPASHNRFAHAALRDLSIITKSIILRPPLSRGPIRVCRLILSGFTFQTNLKQISLTCLHKLGEAERTDVL